MFEYADVTSAIGDTPIVRLRRVAAQVDSAIYAKLEFTNPGGSIKDRVGVYMCRRAAERGELPRGRSIVEGTSGNTGVGVALYANLHDHPCIFVMADKQSADKIANLKAYGARVVLCPATVGRDDPRSYHSVARAIAERLDALHLDQHANPDNAGAHYTQTGPEILRQTGGEFDALVAAVGTGGTISGAGRYLKEHIAGLEVVGVDCCGSVLAGRHRGGGGGVPAAYRLEGIGDSFVPQNVDFGVIDRFETVADGESFLMARSLLRREGIYAGGSSGAAVLGALRYAGRLPRPRRILVILADSGSRYASRLYNDAWMADNGYAVAPEGDALDDRIRGVLGAEVRLA